MNEALRELFKDEIEEAIERGYKEGKVEILLELVSEGLLSDANVAKQLGLSEDDFHKKYRE